jgi:hypothetical protein
MRVSQSDRPHVAWTRAGPLSPPPAAWLALNEAFRARHMGETILASIIAVAPAGTLSTNPTAVFGAVTGLKQIGLDADARRLAVETALAAGL